MATKITAKGTICMKEGISYPIAMDLTLSDETGGKLVMGKIMENLAQNAVAGYYTKNSQKDTLVKIYSRLDKTVSYQIVLTAEQGYSATVLKREDAENFLGVTTPTVIGHIEFDKFSVT